VGTSFAGLVCANGFTFIPNPKSVPFVNHLSAKMNSFLSMEEVNPPLIQDRKLSQVLISPTAPLEGTLKLPLHPITAIFQVLGSGSWGVLCPWRVQHLET